jgi:hypothetical protein
MKNHGQGNKLQKKGFNCGKEIHGQGKNIGQGNLHNGLSVWFYVSLRARCHWSTVFYLKKG